MSIRPPFIAALSISMWLGALAEVKGEQPYPSTSEALEQEILELPWEFEPGSYKLPASGGTLQLADGLGLLRGAAARRYLYLTQGTEFADAEMYILDPLNETQAILAYVDSGYVTLDDWNTVNSDELLYVLKENTAQANIERQSHDISPVEVSGWLQEPRLDIDKSAVYWAILAYEGSGQDRSEVVNATALKLGRGGFERMTWVGSLEQYHGEEMSLDQVVDAHQYPPGYRYVDYTVGDRLAGFGIASLVAVTAGAQSKTAKSIIAATFAMLLVLAKKFIIVPIVLFFGAIWGFVSAIGRRLNGSQRQ